MLELLLLDDEVQKSIKTLIEYAENHVVSYEKMVELQEKVQREEAIDDAIGNNPNHSIQLPLGYRVAYSIEVHPIGECKHISVSVDNKEPDLDNLRLILDFFGFKSNLEDGKCYAYVESYTVDSIDYSAVNVVEPTY
jgi:hypothetical protein